MRILLICNSYIAHRIIDSFPRISGFVSSERPNATTNKTGINIMSFHFITPRKLSTIRDFSVWLKTGSNPADNNRFQSHSGNKFHF